MPRKTRSHPPDKERLVKAELRRQKAAAFRGTFLAWCRTHRLPAPVFEYRFHTERLWRFDLAWPSMLVAVEIHGAVFRGGHHTRGKGFLDDREKMAEAQRLGWTVLEVAPSGKHPNTLYSPYMLSWLKAGLNR